MRGVAPPLSLAAASCVEGSGRLSAAVLQTSLNCPVISVQGEGIAVSPARNEKVKRLAYYHLFLGSFRDNIIEFVAFRFPGKVL